MKPTKQQVLAVLDLLGELEVSEVTEDEAASALIAKCWNLYEQRAKFVVAAQMTRPAEGEVLARPPARFAFGPFATEGDAIRAGGSLVSPTGVEEWAWWVVPVHMGTPATFHRLRRGEHESRLEQAKVDEWRKRITKGAVDWAKVHKLKRSEMFRREMDRLRLAGAEVTAEAIRKVQEEMEAGRNTPEGQWKQRIERETEEWALRQSTKS